MVRVDSGRFSVVSRRLNAQLWIVADRSTYQNVRRETTRSEPDAKALLEKVGVKTYTAELDEGAGNIVAEICRQVLLRTHSPVFPSGGPDGVTYHAGHWVPGAFLSGTTWSPQPDTLAGKFIAMEEALQSYAEATTAGRASARSDLLAKAAGVSAALREKSK
jgi:hypothetical protein